MIEIRYLEAQRIIDYDLLWCIVEVVIPADHVGQAHQCIIDSNDEVVGRRTVRSGNDEIIHLRSGDAHLTLDTIRKADIPLLRCLDTDHRLHTLRRSTGKVPIPSVITRTLFLCHLLFTQGIEFLFAHVAFIGFPLFKKLIDILFVKIKTLRLVDHLTVMTHTDPCKCLQNGIFRLFGIPCHIGIFDTQQEFSVIVFGRKPGEECGSQTTDM